MKVQPALFGTAMIIDDSTSDIFIAKHTILSVNFAANIISYDNPYDAFMYIKATIESGSNEGLPDVIFLDLNMPEMSGFEFLELLKKLPPKRFDSCKVIIVSSSDSIEDIQKSSEYPNIIKYFFKPLKTMDLSEILEENRASHS
jgi:CheY-like chemotaxis protein